MWRIPSMLAAGAVTLALSLLPVTVAAAPDDRAGSLAVGPGVVMAHQAQDIARLQAEVASVTADRDQARAKVTDLQGQVDALQGQLAAVGVGTGSGPADNVAPPPAAGGASRFAFGYCTWYVATRRYVPWLGNAIEWWGNARAFGYAEGSVPRPGAIMVTRDSWWGHVAYVERVNGDGSWVVSEMNYAAWDAVDWRTVTPGGTLVGFIY